VGFFHFPQKKHSNNEGRTKKMNHELTITKRNGCAYIDSREVAEAISKNHNHLLRDIRGYCSTMGKLSNASNFGRIDFFLESTYVDARGREKPCFLLSKMGCEMVANKLTGEKGVLFTAAYVAKFNALEAAERAAEIKAQAKPRLSEFNSAVRNVLNGMSYCSAEPKRVMDFLSGVYEPIGIEVKVGYDFMEYFSATDIAILLSVYSETGNPHAHAVAAIISKLGNWGHHAIAVPYGLVGVSIHYDWSVINRVRKWIADNNNPNDIPHHNFFYHVCYERPKAMYCGDDVIDLGGSEPDGN